MSADESLIALTLSVAVPLRLGQLAKLPPSLRELTRASWAKDAVEPLGSHGDALQYGGKKGTAADTFNHLARGIAALAGQPGGVTAFGMTWCAVHTPMGVVAKGPLCVSCVRAEVGP